MRIMPSFLDIRDGFTVTYPPIHGIAVIGEHFHQCCCPTTAAKNSDPHIA